MKRKKIVNQNESILALRNKKSGLYLEFYSDIDDPYFSRRESPLPLSTFSSLGDLLHQLARSEGNSLPSDFFRDVELVKIETVITPVPFP